MRRLLPVLTAFFTAGTLLAAEPKPGSVIFIHPDGSSLNMWNIGRLALVGPDGMLEWDRLPQLGLYRAHYKDSLAPTSHGGGTVHSYGVKVLRDSFGLDGGAKIRARSGSDQSLLGEARAAGLGTALVQTGHLAEPGTACFAASVEKRADYPEIARQVLASGADVLLGGGEIYLLPSGVHGRHRAAGVRTDGRNLIADAEAAGYTVVYNRDELQRAAADPKVKRLLGVFAAKDTYHDKSEEELNLEGLPSYLPEAPDVAAMTSAALTVLGRLDKRFLLVVEEEGTDNFSNAGNARGTIEALRRADAAIGVARKFIAQNPSTLLLTAADSDASGMQIIGYGERKKPDDEAPRVPPKTALGNAVDGVDGTGTSAFLSAPDRSGRRFWFGVVWASETDHFGAVVARAEGLNAARLPQQLDNTGIYALMWETLFGKELPPL